MSFPNTREGHFIVINKIPVSTVKHPEWRFQVFHDVSLFGSLLESHPTLRIKHLYEEQYQLLNKNAM